jgi:ribosomal protein L40E
MEDKWNDLQAIETERKDLIAKLSKIEEKKTTVSFEVYEKVKGDYEKKLAELDNKITQNAELLKAEMARMNEEEARLDEKEKEIRLRLEEADLRYSIGEYDDTAYQEVADEDKKQVGAIADQRAEIREKLAWLGKFVTAEAVEPETAVAETEEKPAPEPAEEKRLTIDEHILEEKPPDGEQKLDDLLVQEAAAPEVVKVEAPPPPVEPVKKKGEKGVPCPKCGAVNAPDSWYCEKCGAEILSSPSL